MMVILRSRLRCFNPRPPFPGGDALYQESGATDFVVSIHAPRFREAMPEMGMEGMTAEEFQSTPPVSGRRCH